MYFLCKVIADFPKVVIFPQHPQTPTLASRARPLSGMSSFLDLFLLSWTKAKSQKLGGYSCPLPWPGALFFTYASQRLGPVWQDVFLQAPPRVLYLPAPIHIPRPLEATHPRL